MYLPQIGAGSDIVLRANCPVCHHEVALRWPDMLGHAGM